MDPELEAYGFVPEPVARDVIRGQMTALDYHLPSVGDVRFEACRDEPRLEESAVLAGVVHDARLRPIAGATVRVQWSEYRSSSAADVASGFIEEMSGFETTASTQGFYRFCGVPTDMALFVAALVGEEESETYTVRIGVDQGAELQAIFILRNENR